MLVFLANTAPGAEEGSRYVMQRHQRRRTEGKPQDVEATHGPLTVSELPKMLAMGTSYDPDL